MLILSLNYTFSFFTSTAYTQEPDKTISAQSHHLFSYGEIENLQGKTNTLTLADILTPEINSRFEVNTNYTRQINPYHPGQIEGICSAINVYYCFIMTGL